MCLVCIALSKAPASSRPPGHNGLQLPPSPATRAAARASAREPFLARALIFVLVGPHEQTKHLWFPVTSRFRLETFQVFQVYEYSPLFFFFCLRLASPLIPFLYPKPLIPSCFSILHGTPAFQRVLPPPLPLLLLLLPRRSAGQVWERDCPSEVGCYQQGGCVSPIQVSLGYRRGLKSEPQRIL